jgi:hypothetical protein
MTDGANGSQNGFGTFAITWTLNLVTSKTICFANRQSR